MESGRSLADPSLKCHISFLFCILATPIFSSASICNWSFSICYTRLGAGYTHMGSPHSNWSIRAIKIINIFV
ncbi:hypothetical protein B0H19DRAFT_191486 [Mycena capillaripes]|nr:hypothetical protein B0H19DRAFT_191486 [Mycena capillaripes]